MPNSSDSQLAINGTLLIEQSSLLGHFEVLKFKFV